MSQHCGHGRPEILDTTNQIEVEITVITKTKECRKLGPSIRIIHRRPTLRMTHKANFERSQQSCAATNQSGAFDFWDHPKHAVSPGSLIVVTEGMSVRTRVVVA